MRDWLTREITQGRIQGIKRLWEKAVQEAAEQGWEPPSKWQVRRFVDEFSPHDQSAARDVDDRRDPDPIYIWALEPSTPEWGPYDQLLAGPNVPVGSARRLILLL